MVKSVPKEPVKKTFDEIMVGEKASFEVMLTAELGQEFGKLSGDWSPLHFDAGYAATTPFREPIAHGAIAAALFSRIVGMELIGLYALYVSQTLSFHRPMRYGDRVTVKGVVLQKVGSQQTVRIRTEVHSALANTVCVEGEAIVKVLK